MTRTSWSCSRPGRPLRPSRATSAERGRSCCRDSGGSPRRLAPSARLGHAVHRYGGRGAEGTDTASASVISPGPLRLRQHRHRPQRPAAPAADLHRQTDERRAPRRQRAEAGQVLEDGHVGVGERAVGAEVARWAVVDRRRVDADRADAARRREPHGGVPRDAGEVEVRGVAGGRAPEVARPVVPESVPAGADEHHGAVGDPSAPALVRLQVGARQQRVGVASSLLGDVHHHRRPDQPVEGDLVGRPAALGEVDGGVEVRPAVLGGREVVGGVPVAALGHPVRHRLEREGLGRRPVDRPRVEGMGQVEQPGALQVEGRCRRRQGERQRQRHEHHHGPPPGCRSVGMRSIIQAFMARVPSEGPEQLFHFAPAAGAVLRTRRGAEPGEKLLITGIAGGLGRLIAKRLGDYFKVAGVDRSPWEGFPPNVSMHVVDLRKRKFEDVFRTERPDALVHHAFVRHFRSDPRVRHEVNVLGTKRVLEYAIAYGVKRVVVLSSSYVYGALPDNPFYLNEDFPLNVSRTYPEVRDLAEVDTLATAFLWRHPEVTTSILRPVNTLGYYTNSAIRRYLAARWVPTILGFNPMTQFIHEEDVAEAVALALQSGTHGVFNVVGPGAVPLKVAIRETGGTAVPIPEPVARAVIDRLFRLGLYHTPPGAIDFLKYPCVLDGEAFQRATGFTPLFSLEDTFASVRH